MKMLNVVVYCEEDKIKVRLERVASVKSEKIPAIETVATSLKSISEFDILEKFPIFLDEKIVSTLLDRIFFKAKDGFGFPEDKPEKKYYRDAIVYEFPLDFANFINFARAMNTISQICSSAAVDRNQSIDACIHESKLDRGILAFFDFILFCDPDKEDYFKDYHRFLYNILSLENIPETFQKHLQLLQSFIGFASYEYIHDNELSSKPVITDNLLNFISSGQDPFILLDADVPTNTKRLLIDDLCSTFAQEGQHEELFVLFKAINFQAKKELYKGCIGKQAPDGGHYNLRYTECYFLKHAEFNLRADGRMSIIGLSANKGYKQFYDQDKHFHNKFEEEMRYLGQVLGLEFADGCDFHRELIFTEQSTELLKAKGLHYNQLYLDTLNAKGEIDRSRNMFFQPNCIKLKSESDVLQENSPSLSH